MSKNEVGGTLDHRNGVGAPAQVVASLFALLLCACELENEGTLLDGGYPVLTPDAAPDSSSEAAVEPFDATSADAAGAFPDATMTTGDAAVPQVPSDASTDATQPPVDAMPTTCEHASTLKPGRTAVSLMVGGQERRFTLFVPSSYTGSTAVPLVIDFHGLHEGAFLHELFSNWDDRVDEEGYVLAMPQGLDNAWNVGPCCTQSRSVDDEGFARAIVDHVSKTGCIDDRRIYATGYSNGGGMSYQLGCAAADVFAAIAPAAFDLLEEQDCKPSRPLSVFIFRGTDDPIVPYQGGASVPPTLYTLPEIHFLGALKTFERWAQINGCTDTPADSGPGCQSYSKCEAGVKVTLCTKQGGGHDLSTPEDAWPMLRAFSKP